MGSVSVYTGRLTNTETGAILNGQVSAKKNGKLLELPDAIRIYPNNERGSRPEAFVVDMRDADMEARRRFLSAWRGRSNTDNGDRSARAAETRARNAGATPDEARAIGEEARTRTTKKAMSTVLNNPRNAGRFDGIRLMTADEFNKSTSGRRRR